jgi:site-specific recombinase XerD
MLYLDRIGRVWYARGKVNGRRIKKSLDTQFRDVANERLGELERELDAGGGARLLWASFQKEFLAMASSSVKPRTLNRYGFVASRFGRFLAVRGVEGLRQVKPTLVSEYIADRMRDVHPTRGITVGPEGIKHDLRLLKHMFNYALDCKYLAENPVKQQRLNTAGGRTMPFTPAEVDRLLAHPSVAESPERRALVLMFLLTGMRISDVSAFPKAAIDWQADHIILKTKKRGVTVSLPLHPTLREALTVHLEKLAPIQQMSPYLFPSRTGRARANTDALLRRIFRQVGIVGGRAHRFRDTFAVMILARPGASIYYVAKLLGTTEAVAAKHYTPYVKELQERARQFVLSLPVLGPGTPPVSA